jgi:hypothetical protein
VTPDKVLAAFFTGAQDESEFWRVIKPERHSLAKSAWETG